MLQIVTLFLFLIFIRFKNYDIIIQNLARIPFDKEFVYYCPVGRHYRDSKEQTSAIEINASKQQQDYYSQPEKKRQHYICHKRG